MNRPRPLLLGYQSLRIDDSPDAVENSRRVMHSYALTEGYTLATVFTEIMHDGKLSAYEALLEAARSETVACVLVPSLNAFGSMPRIQHYMRHRIETECTGKVLVAQRFSLTG